MRNYCTDSGNVVGSFGIENIDKLSTMDGSGVVHGGVMKWSVWLQDV
jgi:hypothetical protein